ncbi:MAG TPA: hypothetical protein VFY40_27950, partial [Blastocatellia bacterium]|nr:hypothetical protein [Blastocatellia bacterium]
MRVQVRLKLRRLVLAVIALLSFGAILVKQSDQYVRVSAAPQTLAIVNAASYLGGPLARGSLASAFGNNLSSTTEKSQTNPAPTKLAGVMLQIIDSANAAYDAALVYVDSKQINYVIPEEAALGAARVVIKRGDEIIGEGKLEIADAAPALFTAGDRKLAVGMAGADGASVVNTDGSPRSVSLSTPWQPSSVTLLGTGLRYASNLRVRIGDQEVAPSFVGPHPDAPGVDQVEVKIPTTMSTGLTTLSLVVNTEPSATAPSATAAPASADSSSAAAVTSNAAQLLVQPDAPPSPFVLSAADVQLIIAQAVAKAQQLNFLATIAVVDKEGNPLGVFKMNNARSDVLVGSTNLLTGQPSKPTLVQDPDGLERVTLPLAQGLGLLSDGAALAAISKAGTSAFFCTQGSAITTRTASFIVQENFPPTITSQPGGPLFGVQFSSLPCSDVRQVLSTLPLGLAGDPGSAGIYKNGVAVGGVGIEGDGFYSIDINIQDFEQP